jgi:sugar lactone lactonase YvrE
VFVADSGTNQIVVIRVNDLSNPRNYTIKVSGLMGVAVSNGANDIFYTESNPVGVYDLKNDRLINSDFSNPNSLALDSMGNLYVTDYARNAVYKISNSSSGVSSPVSILSVNQPTGIVLLSSGALVVVAKNSGSGRVIIARSVVFLY